MNEEKVQEVFSDEAFVKNLLAMETPEEVQATLQKKGLDLTVEDIVKIKDVIAKKQNTGEELSDEDLDSVVGGTTVGQYIDNLIDTAGNVLSAIGKSLSTYKW